MVHCCAVPGCYNRSNRETELSYFGLPLTNKRLLKIWVYKIGRTNLPVNANTRVCSNHFVSAAKRKLRPDEYPTLNLPNRSDTRSVTLRKAPKVRVIPEAIPIETSDTSDDEYQSPLVSESSESSMTMETSGVPVNDGSSEVITALNNTIEKDIADSKFCIENIAVKDISFYTLHRFPYL